MNENSLQDNKQRLIQRALDRLNVPTTSFLREVAKAQLLADGTITDEETAYEVVRGWLATQIPQAPNRASFRQREMSQPSGNISKWLTVPNVILALGIAVLLLAIIVLGMRCGRQEIVEPTPTTIVAEQATMYVAPTTDPRVIEKSYLLEWGMFSDGWLESFTKQPTLRFRQARSGSKKLSELYKGSNFPWLCSFFAELEVVNTKDEAMSAANRLERMFPSLKTENEGEKDPKEMRLSPSEFVKKFWDEPAKTPIPPEPTVELPTPKPATATPPKAGAAGATEKKTATPAASTSTVTTTAAVREAPDKEATLMAQPTPTPQPTKTATATLPLGLGNTPTVVATRTRTPTKKPPVILKTPAPATPTATASPTTETGQANIGEAAGEEGESWVKRNLWDPFQGWVTAPLTPSPTVTSPPAPTRNNPTSTPRPTESTEEPTPDCNWRTGGEQPCER